MSDGRRLKFLCFHLGGRVFALDIMGIREILRLTPITPVPEAPPTVLGIVNVRGELITVLDMRRVFGVTGEDPVQRDMRIIIASANSIRFGVMVDSVLDVASVELEEIDPAPIDVPGSPVIGIFKRVEAEEEKVVVLLRLGALSRMARGERHGEKLEEPQLEPMDFSAFDTLPSLEGTDFE